MNISIVIPKSHKRVLPLNKKLKIKSFSHLRRYLERQPRHTEIKELWVTVNQFNQYKSLLIIPCVNKTVLSFDGIPLIIK